MGEQEKEKERTNLPTSLDQALATAFSLNSASPNVTATTSTSAQAQGPPVVTGSTRRLRRNTRAESLSDGDSVEVIITSPTKRPRKHAREQAVSNSHTPVTPRVLPRKGKRRQVCTPTTSPRKQCRRVAPPRDPAEADDSDDEVEIVVDMPQRPPKAKPQAKHKYRRSSQQQPASTPPPAISTSISVHASSPASSPPPSSPDVNSLDFLPLTILPAPTRTGIVVPPRALSHLPTSSTPPSDDSRMQQMQRQAIRQGFCCEEPATGAHGLLANPLAAAEPSSLADSGVSATTSDPSPSLQHSDMDLNLDVSMAFMDSDADAEGVTDDEVVVPSPTPSAPHPLLRSSGTHEHPDGPMLGFVVPERADANTSLDHARESPDRGLDLDLTSLTLLGPSVSGGEGWVGWPTQRDLGGTSVSPDTGVGEYAGDRTIDPSVLGGGGGISPSKVDGYSSSPAGRRADLSRAIEEDYRMDDEEEEDVMGLFAANGSDDDFVPPSGMGKGKGKSRAVPMDSVVDSPADTVGASSSTRVQRKRCRKPFPDEAETEYRNKHDDNDGADSRTRAISAPAPAHLDARPKKRRRTTTTPSSSSSTWSFCHHCRCKSRRPKMRCLVIVTSTSEWCRKLYCDGCIEKRYAMQSRPR